MPKLAKVITLSVGTLGLAQGLSQFVFVARGLEPPFGIARTSFLLIGSALVLYIYWTIRNVKTLG
jgi:hypothetical protein